MPPNAFIEADELVLNDFREADRDVLQVVTGSDDLEGAVHRLLQVGARAARVSGATLDTAVVATAFERMTTEFDRKLAEAAERVAGTAGELLDSGGTFHKALGSFKEGFAALIDQSFDQDSKKSVLSKLEAVMSGSTDQLVASVRRLLDPEEAQSPLARYRRDILAEIKEQSATTVQAVRELSERVAVRRAEADLVERTAGKGFTFEEVLHRAVSGIVTPFGEAAERLGTVGGSTGSKVGDETVTLSPEDTGGTEARYVLEAKDRRMPSLKKVLDEVGAAMANREAAAGIAVFSSQDNAPTATPFAYFGDKAVVVLDKNEPDDRALALACAWARWILRRSLNAGAEGVDVERIGAAIDDGRRALARVSSVRRAHSASRNKIDEAAGQVEGLVVDLDRVLETVTLQLKG